MAMQTQFIVAAVLERSGRFLPIGECVGTQLRLNQPAGRIAAHESPSEGAVRECIKESGYSFLPTAGGEGVCVSPILLGSARPVHILTQTATVRRLVDISALAVVDAHSSRGAA